MECASPGVEMFGSLECSTAKHISSMKHITLDDGTKVDILSCTDYDDGHTETMTKPCIGSLPNLDVP